MRDAVIRLGLGVSLLVGASVAAAAAVPEGSRLERAAEGARVSLPASPERIVSTNLTSDEILLALAPPARIAALSRFADSGEVSNVASEARAVPGRVYGDAEQILAHRPDLVLAFPFGQIETEALLRMAGVPVVHVPGVTSVADIRANVRTVAAAVGAGASAEALIRRMDAELADVRRRVVGVDRPRVLFYHQGGFTAGRDTLFDELLGVAGGTNVAAQAGMRGTTAVPVERVLALDPDVLFVVDYRADAAARDVVPARGLSAQPAFAHLSAVRSGRVYALAPATALSTSHHAVRAARVMARQLHPTRVPGAGRSSP